MEEQFIQILNDNKEALFRICVAYSDTHEDARDLLQEVLLNIWKSLPSFEQRSSVSTWAYRIALNVCLRAAQKNKQDKTMLTGSGLAWECLHIAAPENKTYSELYHCIKTLNNIDRSIVMLYLQDLPYRDIATVTGLSENNIAVRMKRIKKKLLNCLNMII